jgi:hypothetical protein
MNGKNKDDTRPSGVTPDDRDDDRGANDTQAASPRSPVIMLLRMFTSMIRTIGGGGKGGHDDW